TDQVIDRLRRKRTVRISVDTRSVSTGPGRTTPNTLKTLVLALDTALFLPERRPRKYLVRGRAYCLRSRDRQCRPLSRTCPPPHLRDASLGQGRYLLKDGDYQPSETRRVVLPNANATLRKIGIPTAE